MLPQEPREPPAEPASRGGGWTPSGAAGRPARGPGPSPHPAGERPAGFWLRATAFLIDLCALGVMGGAISFVLFRGSQPGWAAVLLPIVGLAYFGYFWSERGQSPGMMLTGLRVVRPDGTLLSPGRATARYFALLLALAICAVGVVMVAFDSRKRGLHDRLIDSLVVRTR